MKTNDVITVETKINSTIDKVWKCWTETEHIKKWNYAAEDWYTPKATNDLRLGGKFTYRMEARDGSMGFDYEGEYTNIIEYEKIQFTLDDNRKVSVTFKEDKAHVRVAETFEAEPNNSAELQKNGWQAILDNFKRYVESI